ncbi:MAG: hypothetical protein PWQ08_880 [Clostridiales bacterium]|jgi:DNA-binding MurR/RpiR family transcriptional regulator|nr:hypothetical protein [Clostridiales bacterium]
MNLIDKIKVELDNLTPGERTAAEYILQYPYDAVRFGSSTLADYAGTSRSNVVRFCKKMGFLGFAEFRYELNRTLKQNKQLAPVPAVQQMTVLQEYLAGFAKLEQFYHSTQLQDIAQWIVNARRILVLGCLHSFFSAQQLAFRLNRATIDAHAVSDFSIMQAYGGILGKSDLVIVFSVQGRKNSYEAQLKQYRSAGVKIVIITVTPHCQLAGFADQTLVLPAIAQEYSSDMIDDMPTFYLFIELLMEAVQKLPAMADDKEAQPG